MHAVKIIEDPVAKMVHMEKHITPVKSTTQNGSLVKHQGQLISITGISEAALPIFIYTYDYISLTSPLIPCSFCGMFLDKSSYTCMQWRSQTQAY